MWSYVELYFHFTSTPSWCGAQDTLPALLLHAFTPAATFLYSEIFNFSEHKTNPVSHDSSVGIALGYGLNDRGSKVRLPAGAGKFSLHHRLQNGPWSHPASYAKGTSG
jgi:hypothetical protein